MEQMTLLEAAFARQAVKPSDDVDLEIYIKIAADSVADLRKVDVFRLIDAVRSDNIDGVTRGHLASYIVQMRPDLESEVVDVMAEEFSGENWSHPLPGCTCN